MYYLEFPLSLGLHASISVQHKVLSHPQLTKAKKGIACKYTQAYIHPSQILNNEKKFQTYVLVSPSLIRIPSPLSSLCFRTRAP